MNLAYIQANLSDPPPVSAIERAAGWVSDLLFGPLATSIAVIGVAWLGFAMLSGRIEIRRGLAVLFGCFLMLGARGVADGLRFSAEFGDARAFASVPPPPVYPRAPPPVMSSANAFDPNAGAAAVPGEGTPSQ